MNSQIAYGVNSAFSWLVVVGAIAGYFITLRRLKQKWPLWFVLAAGWLVLAVPNTLLLVGFRLEASQLEVLWLSTFILVMASLLLLFLKLIAIRKSQTP